MNNIKHFPSGLDHQGRYQTRDTASRQIAAEQEWLNTMQVPRRVPLQRVEKRLRLSTRAWVIVGCCVLSWLALLGIVAAVFGAGVMIAAVLAS